VHAGDITADRNKPPAFSTLSEFLVGTRNQKASRAEIDDLERRYELLTPREREVFQLVTAGLLNKQAGAELGASEKTVKVHRGRVMFKMKAESLAKLVRIADQLHIRPASKAD
jgi:FixJ family two-component response regulator